MSATKNFQQCLLSKTEGNVTFNKTGWIEARGAKQGATVELLPDKDMWLVAKVYSHVMPESDLRDMQKMHRGSLPSVERMV